MRCASALPILSHPSASPFFPTRAPAFVAWSVFANSRGRPSTPFAGAPVRTGSRRLASDRMLPAGTGKYVIRRWDGRRRIWVPLGRGPRAAVSRVHPRACLTRWWWCCGGRGRRTPGEGEGGRVDMVDRGCVVVVREDSASVVVLHVLLQH